MILNRYEIFLKTAEIGNITKTAEILHYTQAGISHAIAALEKLTLEEGEDISAHG